ncbi:hypothetical protein [Streptomyces sp. NPDC056132]|uniref:hypothetical protein n=1 Tax=Streptomyces sp. NPDC056132 TaxID=3345722 RepID=UPI0035D7D0C4
MLATPEFIGRGHAQLRLTILKPGEAVIFDLTRSHDTRGESLARPANALVTFPGKTRTVTLDWSAGGSIEGACTDVQVYPPPPHDQLESCGAGPLVASCARGKHPQETGSTAMISKATRAGGTGPGQEQASATLSTGERTWGVLQPPIDSSSATSRAVIPEEGPARIG